MSHTTDNYSGENSSTGIQTVTVATIPLSSDARISAAGTVQVSNESGSAVGVFNIRATAYKGSGDAELRQSATTVGAIPLGLAAVIIAVDCDGNDMRIRATGIALNTLHYMADIRVSQLQP